MLLHLLLASTLLAQAPAPASKPAQVTPFTVALDGARSALAAKDVERARAQLWRALERDSRSTTAWALRAELAAATGDRDEELYALHTQLRLSIAQKLPKPELDALRARIVALDPIAGDLFGMNARFIGTLEPIAAAYEKDGRPHSAIRVHKLILAIDPEYLASQQAIERIAALPDPSLAGDAKPKDLLADVSAEWIAKFDAEHATWETRASLERENYTTYTNAGYEVLVRSAEAMEQMNRFYRVFFQYGTEEDGKTVPRIDLNIFKLRDEYLKLGLGPPVEWSGGHFTGGAVETYVEGQGFDGMTGTLFHEAAHQFVSLATRAAGWLNEGLASFFEGCRILPNGTVLMNMPATHRLFPLAENMERGWMSGPNDGIDPANPSKSAPDKAPTFRIVVENQYAWGPPWYAPTWGVVFFLYNYQDPVDGRFIYRRAFREYVDASGGLDGKTAVQKFEEVVLGQPLPPIKGFDREGAPDIVLPKSIDELDPIWKAWTLELRDEQIGRSERVRPYLRWARAALLAKDDVAAQEHFEKGLVSTPDDVELALEFAEFLAERKNTDRAARLALEALRELETRKPVDEKAIDRVDRLLSKWDPKRAGIERAQRDLLAAAQGLIGRYEQATRPMMVMDLAWRLGRDLEEPQLFEAYERALRASGRSLALWELAYNESNLDGWDSGGNTSFQAAGSFLDAAFRDYAPAEFDYQMLALQRVTSGDYSLEADVLAQRGDCNFTGLVFGRKDANNFHALVLFPGAPRQKDSKAADSAWIDLASFYGGGTTKTWRHVPVAADTAADGQSATARWRKLRIDVAGAKIDCWVDGQLVATHEFASREVLAGEMGLLQGRGRARFKDVRFLARDPRDPASRLERELRMEKLRASGDEAIAGSYVGLVPRFPEVTRWARAPRSSWAEAGLVPQLLVLWSIEQNELIPLHEWLRDLDARYGKVGLRIVSIASPNDDGKLEAYLREHAFPGSVGVDRREGTGLGLTQKRFFIERFNLPRLLLLDIDGKVVWEGDPGFKIGDRWSAGVESYLDAPLAELVKTRKLDVLREWLQGWTSAGAAELAAGDLEKAWPRMQVAKELDGQLVPAAVDVQRKLAALEAVFADLPREGARLEKEGRAAAMRQLVAWAKLAGIEPDKALVAKLKPYLEGSQAAQWERVAKTLETYAPRIAKDPGVGAELADKLAAIKSEFAKELASQVRAASGDAGRLSAVIAAAGRAPARWLARERFGW